MSEIKATGFKPQSCGDMHQLNNTTLLKDVVGGIVTFQIVGTDPDVGVVIGNNLTEDYVPGANFLNPEMSFMICIETVGVFYVNLADGTDFVITAVQATAFLGQWYPARLISVNVGSSGDFSVGY